MSKSTQCFIQFIVHQLMREIEGKELVVQEVIAIQKDFIAHIKSNSQHDSLAFIHQTNRVDITNESTFPQSRKVEFQSNVYDCQSLGYQSLIISNKNMPVSVRIYNFHSEKEQWASIYDRKPNSELFLTPLQFAKHGDTLVGGGKKFLSSYDLTKILATRIKAMDKKYISSLSLQNNNCLITGQFAGELEVLDLRSWQIVSSTRPHMDLVTGVKSRPFVENQFVSLARKDNCCYLWDLRNLNQFVLCFQQQRNKNQRTGLDFSPDGALLYLGGQTGQLSIHQLEGQSETLTFDLNVSKCMNAISSTRNHLYVSLGEREFPLEGEHSSQNYVMELSWK